MSIPTSLSYFDDRVKESLELGTAEFIPGSDVLRLPASNIDTTDSIRVGHILALLPQSRNGDPDDIAHTVAAFLHGHERL